MPPTQPPGSRLLSVPCALGGLENLHQGLREPGDLCRLTGRSFLTAERGNLEACPPSTCGSVDRGKMSHSYSAKQRF